MIITKYCRECKEIKERHLFKYSNLNHDRLSSYCKQCLGKIQAGVRTKLKVKPLKTPSFSSLSGGAAVRGIPFDLDKKEFQSWWLNSPDSCQYCGISTPTYIRLTNFINDYEGNDYDIFKFKRLLRSKGSSNRLTIDRCDNSKGYIQSNLVKACWLCNTIKSSIFTEDHMKIIGPMLINELIAKANYGREFPIV